MSFIPIFLPLSIHPARKIILDMAVNHDEYFFARGKYEFRHFTNHYVH